MSTFIPLGMALFALAISTASLALTIRADRRERARGRDARVMGAVMTKLARPGPAEGLRELTAAKPEASGKAPFDAPPSEEFRTVCRPLHGRASQTSEKSWS